MSPSTSPAVIVSKCNYGADKVAADKAIRDLVPLNLKQAKAHVDAVVQGGSETIPMQDEVSAALLVERLMDAGFDARVDDGNT